MNLVYRQIRWSPAPSPRPGRQPGQHQRLGRGRPDAAKQHRLRRFVHGYIALATTPGSGVVLSSDSNGTASFSQFSVSRRKRFQHEHRHQLRVVVRMPTTTRSVDMHVDLPEKDGDTPADAYVVAVAVAVARMVSMTAWTAVTKFWGSSNARNRGASRAMLGYVSGGRVR